MSQRHSSKPKPDREEPEVDLEPIRQVYDVTTKVIKLGRRWISAQPNQGHPINELGFVYLERMADGMFATFRDTFAIELFGFQSSYLSSESMQNLISANRPLADAVEFMQLATSACYDVLSRINLLHANAFVVMQFASDEVSEEISSVRRVATVIDLLEKAREILGDALDDLEADETPLELVRRLEHSISGGDLSPSGAHLRDRLELILAVFKDHGPGPFRAKDIAKKAGIYPDSQLRADLSTLKSLFQKG
jgi:hypothetical protein